MERGSLLVFAARKWRGVEDGVGMTIRQRRSEERDEKAEKVIIPRERWTGLQYLMCSTVSSAFMARKAGVRWHSRSFYWP